MSSKNVERDVRALGPALGLSAVAATLIVAVWLTTFLAAPTVCSAAMPADWTCFIDGRIMVAVVTTVVLVACAAVSLTVPRSRTGLFTCVLGGFAFAAFGVAALMLAR
jgi:hypothetical protein